VVAVIFLFLIAGTNIALVAIMVRYILLCVGGHFPLPHCGTNIAVVAIMARYRTFYYVVAAVFLFLIVGTSIAVVAIMAKYRYFLLCGGGRFPLRHCGRQHCCDRHYGQVLFTMWWRQFSSSSLRAPALLWSPLWPGTGTFYNVVAAIFLFLSVGT